MTVATTSPSRSGRSGRWLARLWKALLRQEIRVARWMVAQGIPSPVATALIWATKLALIIVVGYAVFWLAVVLVIGFVAVKILARADVDAEPYAWEWRQGFLGLGVYDKSGQRVDPHDPTEND